MDLAGELLPIESWISGAHRAVTRAGFSPSVQSWHGAFMAER